MTTPVPVRFEPLQLEAISFFEGRVVVFAGEGGKLDRAAKRVNRLMRGVLARFTESEEFAAMKSGASREFPYPIGMKATVVQLVRLDRRANAGDARRAGATIGRALGPEGTLILAGTLARVDDLVLGTALRAYAFGDHQTKPKEAPGPVDVMVNDPKTAEIAAADCRALVEGVFFTRDLVSEPANVLTTTVFANRLKELGKIGVKVKVLEERDLEKLGMSMLLAVGQGSDSPSKVVVMEWQGGDKSDAPLALVGKGVVFDTGGISLKPPAGMEDMTMDMGGAGVVAGVMKALASRKARANVVGVVGLVENMPGPNATRPGDIVKSMKGDTVEIINTDAEGRLVLGDLLWYTGETFKPRGMIDLATLTGAVIVALGHDKAGVFSNDDVFCNRFLKAADAVEEGAWRLPLDPAYDKQLKSRLADMKNVGGRPANSITAAQFLQRFVGEGVPWAHLDIAGVALVKADTEVAPKGATGWGVRALDRMIRDNFEG